MAEDSVHNIRVAAVQMRCDAGERAGNLDHAAGFVAETAARGAQIVLLPELMPGGYGVTEAVWDTAETMHGPSLAWLRAQAAKHGIYLGFSFLEAEGEDFYNSFVLADPQGEIAGRVRKNPPASVEAYFYRRGSDVHVIDTGLGRIGVSICYENLLYERIVELSELDVDLVLSPMAAARPKRFLPGDYKRYERMLKRGRTIYSDGLGVANVIANRVGPLDTDLPSIYPHLKSSFPGLSAISDGDGRLLAEMGEEEGGVVADVTLDPARKKRGMPQCFGRMWALPVPWYAFIWPMSQKPGEKDYAANRRRAQKARSISGGD